MVQSNKVHQSLQCKLHSYEGEIGIRYHIHEWNLAIILFKL